MTDLSVALLFFMAAALQDQGATPPATVETTALVEAAASMPETPAIVPPTIVKRDTPLELMATKEISTADVVAGTKFKLRLNKPIVLDANTTIPVGTMAHGEVVTASDSGGLGKSGKMTARLLHLEFGGVNIPLEGTVSAKGTGAGSAGAAVIFTGLAGLFHRGNNAKIKAGEIINAFVAEDTALPSTAAPSG